ncbi:hypothetical protein FNF28_06458 [Cafeteria roenbergensis]|uniref:Peroxisomal membrane protein MPV17 n=1 Tax=Cafeteria roenbergensis TaxID=33653 RepID=A0A5A8D1W3_CAFRO|nr:hypothetical protein FNF28_06458 [Cafeteria roenbergensis]
MGRYPLVGNVISSGVIGATGDVLCQLVVEGVKPEDFDYKRCLRLIAVNCMLVGPTLTVWYGFLGRVTGAWGTGIVPTIKRVLVDQIAFAPPFIAAFFVTAATLEGRADDAPRRLREGWASAVLANYSLWPAAQMINFGLVPAAMRVVFSNCVGVVWNMYLSYATARVGGSEGAAEGEAGGASPPSADKEA